MQVPIRKPDRYTFVKPDPRLTPEKVTELQAKLQHLKDIRPKVAEEVKSLSETGDFSENAGYQTAKARLRGINQRILDLEEQLKHVYVIVPSDDVSTVKLGHHVTVAVGGAEHTFQILGSAEADPGRGIISSSSPMGAALMGHRVGDVARYQMGTKEIECRIVRIT